ncbi:MAG: protein kinase [Slackia sp.]|nr:protein kinase [Slackia sp.]
MSAGRLARYATALADRALVGTTAGDYRLVRLLGQGRYGSCFEVEALGGTDAAERLGETRAVAKLIKAGRRGIDSDAVWAECAAFSLLQDCGANVPCWLGIVHDAPGARLRRRYFIIESFCEGRSIERRLARRERFSDEVVASVGAQLISLSERMAARGVVHGDIRPANVLLSDDGAVSLIDFGLAHFFDRAIEERERLSASAVDIEGIAETMLFMLYSDPKRIGFAGASWQEELDIAASQKEFLSDAFFRPDAFRSFSTMRRRFAEAFGTS